MSQCRTISHHIVGNFVSTFDTHRTSNRPSGHCSTNCILIRTEQYESTKKYLKLCLLNARSIKNKSADFVCYGLSTGADVFAITETWFTDKDIAHKAEITLLGYKLLDRPRTEKSGGGRQCKPDTFYFLFK